MPIHETIIGKLLQILVFAVGMGIAFTLVFYDELFASEELAAVPNMQQFEPQTQQVQISDKEVLEGSVIANNLTHQSDYAMQVVEETVANDDLFFLRIKKGDTLSTIFDQYGLGVSHAYRIAQLGGKYFDNLVPGERLYVEPNLGTSKQYPGIRTLQYHSAQGLVIVRLEGNEYKLDVKHPVPRVVYSNFTLDGSLFASALKAGVPESIIMDMVFIFSWEIDFDKELFKGDRVEMLHEELVLAGEVVDQGNILQVEIHGKDNKIFATRFKVAATTGYYDKNGTNKRRSVLKSPVNYVRISSRFNPNRRHPILHTIRAHNGIDYAATVNTPVVATADGVVKSMSTHTGYGNLVELQHLQSYTTRYAHLNKFANNLETGTKVKQGQVIGYVGKTGLATGYHLHYEVRVGGKPVDPESLPSVAEASIPSKSIKQFDQVLSKQNATVKRFRKRRTVSALQ